MTEASDKSCGNATRTGAGLAVITTHANTDFDAFASMLAAQKLYPHARVVFPASQESSLRNFFVQSMVYLFNLVNIADIDLDEIETLILVDTRQPSRIGPFARILDRPGLSIHIYDHHPPSPGDIQGQVEICRPWGATVSILTHLLKDRGISITADEATIMSLGIYEDTGSFTFASTTQEDFLAAAHLLACGASLNMVASLLSREISPQQITVLNDLIQNMERHRIHGIEVAVSTLSSDDYINDFANLVHKLRKMENLDALFAIARMGNRVSVVARSRISEVDAGKILARMGGGGHRYAASATIKEQPLVQVEESLLKSLNEMVKPRQKARDLMSTPVIGTQPGISIKEAEGLLTQYNVNALIVTQPADGRERLLGFISRQVVEKALHHHLDSVAVSEYMSCDPVTVSPDADLVEIQEKIIGHKQRILPVVKDDEPIGVITRTDLLNILVNESYRMPEQEGAQLAANRGRTRKVVRLLDERLPKDIFSRIQKIGEVADEIKIHAYLVGGFVRDLFLMEKNLDLDLVVEGDGIAFAREVARRFSGRLHTHEVFGTAVVAFEDGLKVDVASARHEYYDAPGSLPIVQTSSLKMDMSRRDFTINTMVIQINSDSFGTLIDFFGAQRDIKAKSIQVLHNLSFVEDPTRVFRAIRFEQRFGFTIGKLTAGLIENAVRMDFFKTLAGKRLFAELKLILSEDTPAKAISRMNDFALLPVIHPCIRYTDKAANLFASVKEVLSWYDLLFLGDSYNRWAVHFLALIHSCGPRQAAHVCRLLEMSPRQERLLGQGRRDALMRLKDLERRKTKKNSLLYKRLKPLATELLLYMMAATTKEDVKQGISLYIRQLQFEKTLVTGKDLLNMQIKPGPVYREILDTLLAARLDGKVKTKEDELALLKKKIA